MSLADLVTVKISHEPRPRTLAEQADLADHECQVIDRARQASLYETRRAPESIMRWLAYLDAFDRRLSWWL